MIRTLLAIVVVFTVLATVGCTGDRDPRTAPPATPIDPLPSWRTGDVKSAIVDYLADITDPNGADFIPVADRVAVLDNDGTSWCERPDFTPTRFQAGLLRATVEAGTTDGEIMPFKAWLANDTEALREFGWGQAYEDMNAQFVGMPVAAYRDSARAFLARERHSKYGTRYTDLYYTPMRELKDLLERQQFQVWIVTGGAQDFVRGYIEDAFGIPPERIIGTWTIPTYDHADDGAVTMVRGAVQQYNGHQHKPGHIEMRIGRRPVFAAGNSNNDEPMCRWSVTGRHRSLALWIHHDDAEREYAYDRGTSRIAGLCRELDQAYEVSMARHWLRVFDHE